MNTLKLPDDKRVELQHGERCAEGTRRPIWLFQKRDYFVDHYALDKQENAKYVEDCGWCKADTVKDGEATRFTLDELIEMECAHEWWDTVTVFLSREEANAFGEAKAHHFTDGWRVYCRGLGDYNSLAKFLDDVAVMNAQPAAQPQGAVDAKVCENCGDAAQPPYHYCKSCRAAGIGIEDDERAQRVSQTAEAQRVIAELVEEAQGLSANVQVLANVIRNPNGGSEMVKKAVLLVADTTVANAEEALTRARAYQSGQGAAGGDGWLPVNEDTPKNKVLFVSRGVGFEGETAIWDTEIDEEDPTWWGTDEDMLSYTPKFWRHLPAAPSDIVKG